MTTGLPSDHDAVETVRARVTTDGAVDRPRLDLPAGVVPEDEPIRLVVEGATYHARVERSLSGSPTLRGAYDNPRLARERTGENRLVAWLREADLVGGSVHVDEVVAGERYGVRRPGKRIVYDDPDTSGSDLRDIARRLGDEG